MHARAVLDEGSGPRLTDLPGVGEALAARLAKEFGTPEAFFDAARRGETARIASVEGVGERRAVDLVLAVQGVDPADFLRTPRARALYDDVVQRVQAFASTDHARDQAALFVPLRDRKAIDERMAFAAQAKAKAAKLPVDDLAAALKRVRAPRTPKPKYDSSVAVLVDTDEDLARLRKAGVDRHCQLVTADDGVDGHDLVVYAYSTGALDLSGADNVVAVPFTAEVADLVPEAAVQWFRDNRDVWEAVVEASRLLGRPSALPDALRLLDEAEVDKDDWSKVEALVRETAARMNADLRARTASLSLSGDEVLDLMAGKTPRKVREVQAEVLRAGQDALMKATGDVFHVFGDRIPVDSDERPRRSSPGRPGEVFHVDDEALQQKRRSWSGRRLRQRFHARVDLARRLRALRPKAEAEVRALLEFDVELMLGRFALAYDLHAPTWGKGWRVDGALHLAIPRDKGDAIDYEIGAPCDEAPCKGTKAHGCGHHPVALLTGANSGGKTTLLETLAQVCILAHMGLPVPARAATVEHVEAVYFFTQKRSLDAGAFESFLKAFVPIVTSRSRKLVLADELEAMTELDAAARIVGTFLELLRESGSCGVCVTHMAAEVSRHTSVRIDGIEARGLDEDMNLVVDRTPRMGYRARSTPEFILRRLEAKTEGAEQAVFRRILEAFGD